MITQEKEEEEEIEEEEEEEEEEDDDDDDEVASRVGPASHLCPWAFRDTVALSFHLSDELIAHQISAQQVSPLHMLLLLSTTRTAGWVLLVHAPCSAATRSANPRDVRMRWMISRN